MNPAQERQWKKEAEKLRQQADAFLRSHVAKIRALADDPALPKRKRNELLERADALETFLRLKPQRISKKDEAVLLYLLEMYPDFVFQWQIQGATDFAKDTISKSLARLRAADLVYYPRGERQGNNLTDKGKAYAERLRDRH
jgi:hypothetical protein